MGITIVKLTTYREGRYRLAYSYRPFRAGPYSPERAKATNDGCSPTI
ncbi:MAG: hypothetical protein ABI169_08975 [Chitinophagaceae bacterium]